ncbi:MAG: TonB-dependent receptor, partial [Saprospiraceae bacterium]
MRNTLFTLLAFLFVSASVSAQKSAISGTVIDEDAFPAYGANVVIQGTGIGATTDFDGKYQFAVEPGTYNIVVTYIGYADQVFENVVVESNETELIDVVLDPSGGIKLEEIVVTASVVDRTENAVLLLRKKSDKVQDVISSQEISRLGAGTAAAALTKVTGTTVVDGKYVYVRGLGDRYSATTVNGLRLPSIDPYRNSAQLDLIPSSLLDNIVASKTFTPDLPGDFTGGSVNIKLKDLPERFIFNVSVSSSYNEQNNFRDDFLSFDAGDKAGLGYNDGTLDRPAILSDPEVQGDLGILRTDAARRARRDDRVASLLDQAIRETTRGGEEFALTPKSTGPDYSLG